VAAQAGVPLAAATYYFSSIDDLLASALRQSTEAEAARLDTLRGATLRRIAAAIVDYIGPRRAGAIASYELLFAAMRHSDHAEEFKSDAALWSTALHGLVADYLGRYSPEALGRTAAIAWAIDGLLLTMLWSGHPGTVDETEAALREILATS
jgi:DNA-binding transcriptional regulator YbjK